MSRIPVPPTPHNPLAGDATRAINQLARQVNELSSFTGNDGLQVNRGPLGTTVRDTSRPNPMPIEFYGVIVNAGPAGTSDFTDSRYWVRSIQLSQTQGASATGAVSATVDASFLFPDGSYGGAMWVVATNLLETMTGTHSLPVVSATISASTALPTYATIVKVQAQNVWKSTALASDPGNVVFTFLPVTNAGLLTALGRITGVTGTHSAYVYAVTFQNGGTANAYNIKDWNGTTPGAMIGSPCSLGINVGSSGQVNSGTCVIKSIGTSGGYFTLTFDNTISRWTFNEQVSAQ